MKNGRLIAALVCASALALSATASGAAAQQVPQTVDWTHYGGDDAGTRYSPLRQFTPENVSQLKEVWRYDLNSIAGLQNQPIVIDGILYASGGGKVFALDAATGEEKWTFQPNPPFAVSRGQTWWTDGKENRLFAGSGNFIYCLDPATGQPIPEFGNNGRLDLRENLRGDPANNNFRNGSPVNVWKDMIITAGGTGETTPTSPGDIRAWDVRTGALRWVFHTIPHPGEKYYDTWPEDAYLKAGAANNWVGNVIDDKRGIIYVATGSGADDFYGGERLGDNRHANSVIALNADNGELLWSFQAVHHDLWDADFSAQPVLMTIRKDGKEIEAVAASNKAGYLYVLDRLTGEPVFPVKEVPVPQNTLEGDVASPTQPLPQVTPPLARTTVSADDLTTRTPEANAWAREKLATFYNGPQFTPVQKDIETIVAPGFSGGVEWGGMTYDPNLQYLFANTENIAWSTAVVDYPEPPAGAPPARQPHSKYSFSGYHKFYDQDGYPATAAPWGYLTAIDMTTGKFAWRIPFGEYPELVAAGLKDTGSESYGGGIATANGLFFIAATIFDRKLRAFESATGKLVWETELPYAGNATPAMYMVNGKQYLAIGTSSGRNRRATDKGSAFVAYALPD